MIETYIFDEGVFGNYGNVLDSPFVSHWLHRGEGWMIHPPETGDGGGMNQEINLGNGNGCGDGSDKWHFWGEERRGDGL